MKPDEGCEIGQDDLSAQIGLLILEGRALKDAKSNVKGYVKCGGDGFIHCRKEDFMSLWKSCNSIYIEVWLYHQEQFNEKEAMNGHSGYLLMEQWEIEIKLNRSSEHGFHCSEKMLRQAIHSKLYFSQLSAWLSLTHGKFPKHIYFRLCQTENKTPLTRFIRAPDFHQFPEVNISATKELVVCLHSLPHSDLTSDYPMFSWALTDQPYETPQRKFPEKLRSDLEGDTVSKDDSLSRNRSQDKPYSFSPSRVVRKLQFENVSLAAAISSEKLQWVEKDADMPVVETFENIKTTKTKHSVYLTEWDFSDISATKQTSKYFAKGMQNLVLNKNEAVGPRGVSNDDISITHFDLCRTLVTSESLKNKEKTSAKSFAPNNQADKQGSFYERFPDFSQSGICEAKELNVSARKALKSSTISKEQMQDQGICEIMQSFRNDEISRRTDSYDFVSKRAHECEQKFISVENQVLERCCDSENVRNKDLNSEFRPQEIFRKSLLTRSIGARSSGHTTSNEDFSPDKVCGDTTRKLECSTDERASLDTPRSNAESSKTKAYSNLRSKEMIIGKDRKSSRVLEGQQRSNLRLLNATSQKSSNNYDEYGNVLDRTEKDLGDILPEVRHVMDNDYEKNLNKRLSKCCSLSRNSSREKEEDGSERKNPEGSVKTEENVFSEQKFTEVPSHNSRHHFRHASTGTLTVFHPRTGLPLSSSPAPFRKTSPKQSVDDICSPSREPSSLFDQCGNLSKSAPTLTTQSLLVNFEESVLNDRLRPDGVVEGFTAELSASSSKKCLPHVTLPVQASFFRLSDDNAPSPYMGYISLDVPGLPKKGYHVPKKGTIQLTLFNPNQTVVKVFIVLYDFSDMQPNFQTFLRQKTTSLVKSDGLVNRIHDNLHYLIHLRFASSKSGRIYLHTDIRVIFARHPPDQGHLRTATSGPTNPKYVPRHDQPGGF